jgi:hypothetical protein
MLGETSPELADGRGGGGAASRAVAGTEGGAGVGGAEARWGTVGAAVVGVPGDPVALAGPFRPDCTEAGSAAAQGTSPHSWRGAAELS